MAAQSQSGPRLAGGWRSIQNSQIRKLKTLPLRVVNYRPLAVVMASKLTEVWQAVCEPEGGLLATSLLPLLRLHRHPRVETWALRTTARQSIMSCEAGSLSSEVATVSTASLSSWSPSSICVATAWNACGTRDTGIIEACSGFANACLYDHGALIRSEGFSQ